MHVKFCISSVCTSLHDSSLSEINLVVISYFSSSYFPLTDAGLRNHVALESRGVPAIPSHLWRARRQAGEHKIILCLFVLVLVYVLLVYVLLVYVLVHLFISIASVTSTAPSRTSTYLFFLSIFLFFHHINDEHGAKQVCWHAFACSSCSCFVLLAHYFFYIFS